MKGIKLDVKKLMSKSGKPRLFMRGYGVKKAKLVFVSE